MKLKIVILITLIYTSCNSQSISPEMEIQVGGPCEGCEAIYEYGNKILNPIDTLPEFEINEPKILITGTVYRSDKITPADGIIIYMYHTNRQGLYEKREGLKGWGRRHGIFRGWTKTGKDGKYTFYSFRPASYPDNREPEHIHMTIKEPMYSPYYIDDILFEDDPLLTETIRRNRLNRGGSGIVNLQMDEGFLVVNRDIILGMNIPEHKGN